MRWVLFLSGFLLSGLAFAESFPQTVNPTEEDMRYQRDLLAVKQAKEAFESESIPWMTEAVKGVYANIDVSQGLIRDYKAYLAKTKVYHPEASSSPKESGESWDDYWRRCIKSEERYIAREQARIKEAESHYKAWSKYFEDAPGVVNALHKSRQDKFQALLGKQKAKIPVRQAQLEKAIAQQHHWDVKIGSVTAYYDQAISEAKSAGKRTSLERDKGYALREPRYRLRKSQERVKELEAAVAKLESLTIDDLRISGYPRIELAKPPTKPLEQALWEDAAKKIKESTIATLFDKAVDLIFKPLLKYY